MPLPADDGCAVQRLLHAEPLPGTAPEAASSWLLVEHPGPWPAKGLPADLPAEARAVVDAAAARGVRPQLVRPVRERRRPGTLLAVASVRPGARWLEVRQADDVTALAGLDLEALAAGTPPGFGERVEGPLVLVCTHGKRDVCCARRGRPLAAALDVLLPGLVLETNHVGGDRFAPNVVSLPAGTYHGGAGLPDVPALAAALRSTEVVPRLLRGTAGRPAPLQAAECFAREATGLVRLDDVRALGVVPAGEGPLEAGAGAGAGAEVEVEVEVRAGAERLRVRLLRQQAPDVRLTTCSAGGTWDRPTSYVLAAPVTRVPATGSGTLPDRTGVVGVTAS